MSTGDIMGEPGAHLDDAPHPAEHANALRLAEEAEDPRPLILLDPDRHAQAIATASRHLAAAPDIYRRADRIATTSSDDDGRPLIVTLSRQAIRERLAHVVRFGKRLAKGGTTAKLAPDEVVGWLLEPPELEGYRVLRGITESPTLRPDGGVLEQPGYDPSTGLVYRPRQEWPRVGDKQPTRADARDGLGCLVRLLCDFPFQSREHGFGAIAAMLTIVGRPAYQGCTPCFLIDANTRGAGKGLLVDVACEVALGRAPARMPASGDDDEMRKRVLAMLLGGSSVALIDNVTEPLGGSTLDALTTSETWSDRILGESRTITIENRALLFATGNNVALAGDMVRRVLHVRLNSPLAEPELRSDYKVPDIIGHVRENRPRYLRACLDVLRAYMLAGQPAQDLAPWGSFDRWSRLIRGAIVWAGGTDPGTTRVAVRAADDQTEAYASLLALLEAWQHKRDETRSGSLVSAIVTTVDKNPTEHEDMMDAILSLGRLDARSLCFVFRSRRDQIVTCPDGERRVLRAEKHRNTKRWRVERA